MKEFAILITCEAENLAEALLETAAYVQAFQPMFTHMRPSDQVPVNEYIAVQRAE